MALGAGDFECHGVFHVRPAGRQGAGHAAVEAEQGFAAFVGVAVTANGRLDVGGGRLDVAEHPHEDVEHVRAHVAEGADAGDLGIGHPLPLAAEPAAQRGVMAVRGRGAGDFSQVALGDLVLEEQVCRHAAIEIAGGKEHAGLFNRGSHLVAFFGVDAQGLLDEEVFVGLGGGKHEIAVAVGLGVNRHAGNLRVGVDLLDAVGHFGPKLIGISLGAIGVRIPNVLDANVGPGVDHLHKRGRVDMGRSHQRQK